eukprot:scaffold229290_cov28-Tisochrysis_lutea.AAC.3
MGSWSGPLATPLPSQENAYRNGIASSACSPSLPSGSDPPARPSGSGTSTLSRTARLSNLTAVLGARMSRVMGASVAAAGKIDGDATQTHPRPSSHARCAQ